MNKKQTKQITKLNKQKKMQLQTISSKTNEIKQKKVNNSKQTE